MQVIKVKHYTITNRTLNSTESINRLYMNENLIHDKGGSFNKTSRGNCLGRLENDPRSLIYNLGMQIYNPHFKV